MILLSITLGLAWKHWELVRDDTDTGEAAVEDVDEHAGEVLENNLESTEDI